MNTKLKVIILLYFLVGCASMTTSQDLNENVQMPQPEKSIGQDTLITLSKVRKQVGRSEMQIIPYSVESYSEEINVVKATGIFRNPIFADQSTTSQLLPKIEVTIIRTWFSEGCYMGGCMVWPTTHQVRYDIQFKVYDSAHNLIFLQEESIFGESRRTSLDFSLGFKPLRQVDNKAPALLIKRSLAKFQASDAFKKLFEIPKKGNE